MIPDHDCVPGLERAVTLSEYATLENLREADVLAVIGQQKIPSAYFRGQWFLEAPRNCEARLAQLRGEQPTPRNDKANIPHNDKGNIPALEDKEFWGRIEREGSSYEPQPEPQRAHQERQPVSETRGYRLSELPRKDRIEHYVHLDLESQKPPPSAALAKPSTTPDRLQPVN